MKRYLLLPLLLILVCLGNSCKKSPDQPPPIICPGPGTPGTDEEIKNLVIYFISQLSSPEYTADNFDKLAKVITDRCSLDAQVPCFNCIKTLPVMTELIISFPNSMTQKAVDISYT